MACTIEDVTDVFDPTDFDKALGDLLIGHESNAQQFLVSIFDFLQRKTNFFKEPANAKRRVLDAYKQVTGEALAAEGFKGGFFGSAKPAAKPAPAADKPVPKVAVTPAAATPASAQGTSSTSTAATTAAAEAGPSSSAAAAAPAAVPATPAAAPTAPAAATEVQQPEAGPSQDVEIAAEKSDQEKGLKPNAGRGADLGTYSWTQTLQEVSVAVPVGRGVKGKQLDVVINKQHLTVGVKGQPPILDGGLSEPIKADDSMWNLTDGVVELTLTKAEGMHWWKSVLADGPAIDVQAVEPENSKLADLDPETRQTVEKMMFDQRQKALGLPTSEEMHKQEMLQRFMAAHPEMDFSNAKIM